jgi:hypothetical protein
MAAPPLPDPEALGEKEQRRRRNPHWRRALRIALGVLAVPVVLVALAIGYLHTSSGKERIRALIERRLGERVNGTVALGGLDYALFGELRLSGLRIRDAKGAEAIALDSLRIAPAWGELIGGKAIAFDAVEIRGVRVRLVKDETGGSNVKALFKPSSGERKPIEKRIELRRIELSGIEALVTSPDGTELGVRGASMTGHFRAHPASKHADVALAIGLEVKLAKPAAQGGLALSVDEISTGIRVALTGGTGKLSLDPLRAKVAVTIPDKLSIAFPIAWEGITLDVGDGGLGASLQKLGADALSLASIELRAKLDGAGLPGEPKGDILGLHVDAAKVNALLGRSLLKSDIDLEAHLAGDAAAPTVQASLATKAGKISLDAKLDTSGREPVHDATLRLEAIDTDRLVDASVVTTPMKVASLSVRAKGRGRTTESIDTRAELEVRGAQVKGVSLDVRGTARVEGARVTLENLVALGLDQKLSLSGSFDRGSKAVDVEARVQGDVGVAIAKLKEAKLPIAVNVPAGMVKLPEDDLRVHVTGTIGGALEASLRCKLLAVAGGRAVIDGRAKLEPGDPSKGEKKLKLANFDADVSLYEVSLSRVLALRGKRIDPAFGVDAGIGLHVVARGTPREPRVWLQASVAETRKDGGATGRVDITGHVHPHEAKLDVVASRNSDKRSILEAHARVPLTLDGEKKGIDRERPLDVRVSIPRTPLAAIAELAPQALLALDPRRRALLESGALELAATIEGKLTKPTATAKIDLAAGLLEGAPRQRLSLDASLIPTDAGGSDLTGSIAAAIDEKASPIVSGNWRAGFPSSPLAGGLEGVQFAAHFAIAPTLLSSLPEIAKLARVRALGGSLGGTVDVDGTRHDLGARVRLTASGLTPKGKGPFDVGANVDLLSEHTTVDVGIQLAGSPLAKLTGTIGVAGNGLLHHLRDARDPSIALALDVPSRPLSSLAVLRSSLAKAPGTLSGHIDVGGRTSLPNARGQLRVGDVAMWSGETGGAVVAVSADTGGIAARVGLGKSEIEQAPVTIAATVGPVAIARFLSQGVLSSRTLPIEVKARAARVDLKRLVPKTAVGDSKLDPKGELDWNMDARIDLEKRDGGVALGGGSLDGKLTVDGTLPIPESRRQYDRIALAVDAKDDAISLERLELHESDREVKDRLLRVSGKIELSSMLPKSASLTIAADRWLLFGLKNMGAPDAPRGALTIAARATADLQQPIKKVAVDVTRLDVSIPDRFDKAHQPEELHVGDVFEIGDPDSPLGKLPVPESKKAAAAADPASAEATPAATSEESGLDVDIAIAPGARVLQSPIELVTGGKLHVASRPSGRSVRGQLKMSGGELSLGGKMHPLREGSLTFDEAHPKGHIDLTFDKPLPPSALRGVSEASAGKSIVIRMTGPIADRKTVLSGAGSPGALWDLLAMHNEGRERAVADVDLPRSITVDFPRHEGLLVLSFLSVNLPHLLFLDRVAAWADAHEAHRGYGRVEHFEAERYFSDGKGRFRAAKRPRTLGQSEAELEVDYLFVNRPRMLFGVGATGGSRGGGGPTMIFEWSSKE